MIGSWCLVLGLSIEVYAYRVWGLGSRTSDLGSSDTRSGLDRAANLGLETTPFLTSKTPRPYSTAGSHLKLPRIQLRRDLHFASGGIGRIEGDQ